MNSAMLEHPATAENLRVLAARGVTIVEPGSGFLAERESGPGRLAAEDAIVAAMGVTIGPHTPVGSGALYGMPDPAPILVATIEAPSQTVENPPEMVETTEQAEPAPAQE